MLIPAALPSIIAGYRLAFSRCWRILIIAEMLVSVSAGLGYRIYWGRESGSYASSVEIMNPAITTFVVENLSSGTHYFAAAALNKSGVESDLCEEAITTIP